MGTWQKILEKYHVEKWFQRDNLIVLVLAGILLVVIALPTKDTGGQEQTLENAGTAKESVSTGGEGAAEEGYTSLYEYGEYLEQKLTATLEQMEGVGEVSVMITFSSSAKQIVEKDASLTRSNTTESDSQGGTRSVYDVESGEETIYIKTDSEQQPYVIQTILPEISGVLIVAGGAKDAGIKVSIVETAQALFDVEAHKISVVAMGEKESG